MCDVMCIFMNDLALRHMEGVTVWGNHEGLYLDRAARHWHSPMARLFGGFRLKSLEAVS